LFVKRTRACCVRSASFCPAAAAAAADAGATHLAQLHNARAHAPLALSLTTPTDAHTQKNTKKQRHECPQWRAQDLSRVFPTLEEAGVDLLRRMLAYDPAKRLSVRGGGGGSSFFLEGQFFVSACFFSRLSLRRIFFFKKRMTPRLFAPPKTQNTQAKEALNHPYFDTGFDRAAVDALENPELLVDE
jgi:hypothetical protein